MIHNDTLIYRENLMHATNFNNYLQKLKVTKTLIDAEYLGADTEIDPGVLEIFALELDVKTRRQVAIPTCDSNILDEYELAMAS